MGNQIVDSSGKSVWLTGANWFGMNASERVFHGLWSANMESLVRSMAQRGINIVRVPISTTLIKEWMSGTFGTVNVNTYMNPNLVGKNSLEIWDHFLLQVKSCGMKVLIDVHSAEADNSGHIAPLWYKGTVTTADFYDAWEWFANRYKNNDTIVAYDLKNEPHGIPNGSLGNDLVKGSNESWESYCLRKPVTEKTDYAKWDDSADPWNWRYAAEVSASRILALNPKALILVEGIEATPVYGKEVNHKSIPDPALAERCHHFNWWGGNLRLAKDKPVSVAGLDAQIMYSPHDYGPLVYRQPWFYAGFTRDTLRAEVWMPNWLYLHEENISPLLLGEWGGFMDGGDNEKWMTALRDEIVAERLHHTFWCINPNSGDTGGLVGNDWSTWDEAKYSLLKPALWQSSGKFVGLDKVIPLGGIAGTGIARP